MDARTSGAIPMIVAIVVLGCSINSSKVEENTEGLQRERTFGFKDEYKPNLKDLKKTPTYLAHRQGGKPGHPMNDTTTHHLESTVYSPNTRHDNRSTAFPVTLIASHRITSHPPTSHNLNLTHPTNTSYLSVFFFNSGSSPHKDCQEGIPSPH